MEKENKKRNMLSGFFDNCKDLYLEDKEIGSNPLEQFNEKKKTPSQSAEEKLKEIKRIVLE